MESLAALDFYHLCGPVLEGTGSLCSWASMIFVDNRGVVNIRYLGFIARMQRGRAVLFFSPTLLFPLPFSPILAPLLSCLASQINLAVLNYLVAIASAFSFFILVDS